MSLRAAVHRDLRETGRDFQDWRRREPWWCAITCAWFAFFAVQGVLRLLTGGDDPAFWLAIAFMYGAYIGAKLEVSRARYEGFVAGAASVVAARLREIREGLR